MTALTPGLEPAPLTPVGDVRPETLTHLRRVVPDTPARRARLPRPGAPTPATVRAQVRELHRERLLAVVGVIVEAAFDAVAVARDRPESPDKAAHRAGCS